MFFGSYDRTLDEKNRLMIPKKMLESLSRVLYIMKGFDGAISIYEEAKFQALVEKMNSMPFTKKDTRSYMRAQLANTFELDVDKLGRIQLPTALIQKFGINKDVVVLGAGDHIEIWDKVGYETYLKETENQFEAIAESLSGE